MPDLEIHDMVATRTLSLRDRSGIELARLSAQNGNPSLEMRDSQGRVRLEMTLQRDGRTYMSIFGADGSPRVNIDVLKDGSPSFEVLDNDGKVLLGTS